MSELLAMSGHTDELAGITLNLALEFPGQVDQSARQIQLWARDTDQWRLAKELHARPGTTQSITGLRPDTDHRVSLDRNTDSGDGEIAITFHTPTDRSRLTVTVVVHRAGFEVSASIGGA